jgi:hypothetical protein
LSIGLFGDPQFEGLVFEAGIASALLPAHWGAPLTAVSHTAALGRIFHILCGAGHLYTQRIPALDILKSGGRGEGAQNRDKDKEG